MNDTFSGPPTPFRFLNCAALSWPKRGLNRFFKCVTRVVFG